MFKKGNKKLPKSILIFNMGPAHGCPSDELGFCKVAKVCYAKKAERTWPVVKSYRERQKKFWLSCSVDTFVREVLRFRKIKYFRFNESGDFFSQKCVDKAEKIARKLKKHGITTYTYTARRDLDFSNCRELVVNGSGFMVHNNFSVQSKEEWENAEVKCSQDCSICKLCMKKRGLTIIQRVH